MTAPTAPPPPPPRRGLVALGIIVAAVLLAVVGLSGLRGRGPGFGVGPDPICRCRGGLWGHPWRAGVDDRAPERVASPNAVARLERLGVD